MLTNGGKDFIKAQVSGTASTASAQYMALTANSTAPAATDTTLAGEITTAGLTRAAGTFTLNAGTSSCTLSKTFTAVSADVAGGTVTVNKVGVLNAVSVGTLVFETALSPAAVFAAAGDATTITQTITYS